MKFTNYILITLFCCSNIMFSQQISVDNTVPLQQLIEDNLIDGCVDITNISSSVNGSSFGLPSFGYFERAGSNFPFENGIVLTTGNASSAGNSAITPTLSEGSSIWGTDPDLEAALATSNTLNATSIEFDIVSISSQFQFNYLFASEDYDGINPCQVSDGFVFLIKETGSPAPYQNIALVPGTSDPVNTGTVHTNLLPACAAQNEQYFDGYNIGDTNYIGRTTVLTASTTIQPNVSYHIKIIIADQTDGTFDSAVFIEGDSFKILDLGDDISTCAGSALLDADIENPLASYEWFLNGASISGETNPTYNTVQNGTYKVEVSVPINGTDCVEEDEIIITLNTEETITPISDYELCDDISGDGIELFDLSTKTPELTPNIPFTNYTFSYHFSEAEARGNINDKTTPITNPLNPQPIFVRIQDLDTNCFAYTSFNLVVNPLPTIIAPSPLPICDSDDSPDGTAVIDLSVKDNEITDSDPNLNVTYHYNPTDASNGNSPIPIPFISDDRTVYVRVVNLQTGCASTTTLDINITISPIVNRDTQYIDACDADLDGTATFDLTKAIANILDGLSASGVTVTFHEDYDDAETGTDAIADETNYENLVPEVQILYARIEDNVTGCASIVPIEIHTNLLLTGTDIGDFAQCDNNDDETDSFDFNLNTLENFINNDLPNPVTVTFFESEDDRDNNINPLDKTQLFSALSPSVVYIRLDDGNCPQVAEITLLVNPVLFFESVTPLPYCDTDDDGIVSIDLHSLDDQVTNGDTNYQVTYFPTNQDAENNTLNQLPPLYTNTNPRERIFARIEHITTGCATVNPFEIEVRVAPAATEPTPYIICDIIDANPDGFSIINLEDKISEVVSDPSIVDINFFTTYDDAIAPINPIPVTDLTSYNTDTQIIYIRVESNLNDSGCFNIVELEVIVNTEPIIPTISNFQICQVGGSSTADFLLADKDEEILNGQTDKEVYYFENQIDATSGNIANAIDKDQIYQNTSSPQPIYVRVENLTDNGCYATSSFILQVSPDPIYTAPAPFLVCDDITNDEVEIFDLNEKRDDIILSSSEALNVSFHFSQEKAEDNEDPLPDNYSNEENPQTIFIRIESDDSLCYVIEELSLNILQAPDITQVSMPLIECDADYDGLTTFNLENADFEILDRIQTSIETHYFENFDDINAGLDNTNEILNPTGFISGSKTVFIKVLNTQTQCSSIISLELIANLPPQTNNLEPIEICDNDTDTYDLLQVDTMVVNDTSLVTISYHDDPDHAEDNLFPLDSIYNYMASNQEIYARVTDINNGCHIVVPFDLQINPNPIANIPPDLIECDDDFDGSLEFDLSTNTNVIIGTQTISEHIVTYYNEQIDAEEKANVLDNLHTATDGEVIFARIENRDTGCFNITQFTTFINPLPIIPIDDFVPLCINRLPLIIDAYTGNPDDSYEWSTGETTSQIQLNSATDIGDYWVSATTPNIGSDDCTYTKNFKVIESEDAILNFTTTVDFADPNSITVDISGIGDYVFILDDGEPQTSNVFENVTFGVHIVTIRDLNGCEDVFTEVVVVDIPKFVTPNNDGFYDTWHIVGIDQIPGTVVYIYNRHGKLLKTLPHTSVGWDGTFNGQKMPSDDYWFVAKVIQNGETFDLKGHFALKR